MCIPSYIRSGYLIVCVVTVCGVCERGVGVRAYTSTSFVLKCKTLEGLKIIPKCKAF
jgi:hypothetical protein